MTHEQIAAELSAIERAFILRMKPTLNQQRMRASEYGAISPVVDFRAFRAIWWGGMRVTWPCGRATYRFQFNTTGLAVRKILQEQNDAG